MLHTVPKAMQGRRKSMYVVAQCGAEVLKLFSGNIDRKLKLFL